jgi:hypothetical protein
MSFKLRGKEIFYAVEATIREYAWKKRGNSTTTSSSRTEGRKSNRSVESDRDELTSKFVGLGGTYNSERKRVLGLTILQARLQRVKDRGATSSINCLDEAEDL